MVEIQILRFDFNSYNVYVRVRGGWMDLEFLCLCLYALEEGGGIGVLLFVFVLLVII